LDKTITGDLLICCHGIKEEALLPVFGVDNVFSLLLITTPTATHSPKLPLARLVMGEDRRLADMGDRTPDVPRRPDTALAFTAA
jgi:hypothetical protein